MNSAEPVQSNEEGAAKTTIGNVRRSTGEIILGPPKSKAGRRIVGIPRVIIPESEQNPS
jgi:hypothetical protein